MLIVGHEQAGSGRRAYAVVSDVRNHSDHLENVVLVPLELDAFSDGVFTRKQYAGRSLIEDGDAWGIGSILNPEGATVNDGNAHDFKVAGGDHVDIAGGPRIERRVGTVGPIIRGAR